MDLHFFLSTGAILISEEIIARSMYVYILGGFLGSGKTTLLMKLASMYTSS